MAYFGVFARRLQDWDDEVPLACYNTEGTSYRGHRHPFVDMTYICLTSVYTMCSLIYASFLACTPEYRRQLRQLRDRPSTTPRPTRTPVSIQLLDNLHYPRMCKFILSGLEALAFDTKMILVAIAVGQSPVHIYMIFALRHANEPYLDTNDRIEWGFGQIVALVLLGANMLPFIQNMPSKFVPWATTSHHKLSLTLEERNPTTALSPDSNENVALYEEDIELTAADQVANQDHTQDHPQDHDHDPTQTDIVAPDVPVSQVTGTAAMPQGALLTS
jgi:hypothetical protein